MESVSLQFEQAIALSQTLIGKMRKSSEGDKEETIKPTLHTPAPGDASDTIGIESVQVPILKIGALAEGVVDTSIQNYPPDQKGQSYEEKSRTFVIKEVRESYFITVYSLYEHVYTLKACIILTGCISLLHRLCRPYLHTHTRAPSCSLPSSCPSTATCSGRWTNRSTSYCRCLPHTRNN